MFRLVQPVGSRRYRPDIDGLRALAVLSVLLFHVGIPGLHGGFVGVDVFFVISGYLITRNIIADLDAGQFSFVRFYIRRLRRLFPALLFTVAVSFLVASLLFSPQHLERLGLSVIAALFSASNFLFWQEAGYFDASAEYKPLLHTWSLAVEEQFYLLWPALLFVLMKLRRDGLVIGFLVLSGVLSLIWAEQWLPNDRAGAFYLAPFRVMEFAVGALCVWLLRRPLRQGAMLEILALLGLFAVIMPVFVFSAETPFPGRHALWPALGAGLLIYAGTARFVGRVLNNRLAVAIGVVSYSAYLVHWPIIVFYRYWRVTPLSGLEQAAIVLASLALAVLMYQYIERPFRVHQGRRQQWRPAAFFAVSVGLAGLLCLPAAHAWLNQGWAWRLPEQIRNLVADVPARKRERFAPFNQRCGTEGRDCKRLQPGRSNIVVLGDSHGIDGFNALSQAYPEHHYLLLAEGGCPPLVDVSFLPEAHPRRAQCIEHSRFLYQQWRPLDRADMIVFSMLIDDRSLMPLAATLRHLRERTQASILVLGTAMVFEEEVPTLVAGYGRLRGLEPYLAGFADAGRFEVDAQTRLLSEQAGVGFVSKLDLFCPGRRCRILSAPEYPLLTYDKHHLGLAASRYLARRLRARYPSIQDLAVAGRDR